MKRAAVARRRAPMLLALVCFALCGVIYAELDRGSMEQPANAAPAPRVQPKVAPVPASFTMPPLQQYAELIARPLFSESRRPMEGPREAATESSGFALLGIVVSESGRYALLEHGKPPRVHRLGEGEALAGWTIEQIQLDRLVVRNGTTREQLKPKAPERAKTPGTVAAPAAAVPAAGAKPPAAPPPTPESAKSAKPQVRR
jgi:hypothetical protein